MVRWSWMTGVMMVLAAAADAAEPVAYFRVQDAGEFEAAMAAARDRDTVIAVSDWVRLDPAVRHHVPAAETSLTIYASRSGCGFDFGDEPADPGPWLDYSGRALTLYGLRFAGWQGGGVFVKMQRADAVASVTACRFERCGTGLAAGGRTVDETTILLCGASSWHVTGCVFTACVPPGPYGACIYPLRSPAWVIDCTFRGCGHAITPGRPDLVHAMGNTIAGLDETELAGHERELVWGLSTATLVWVRNTVDGVYKRLFAMGEATRMVAADNDYAWTRRATECAWFVYGAQDYRRDWPAWRAAGRDGHSVSPASRPAE